MPISLKLHRSLLDNKGGVLCHLSSREYNTLSNHRRIHHVIGTLITSNSYTFKKVWTKHSRKHISCDGRLAFFDNYVNCIDCSSSKPGPHKKFSLSADITTKIEDALTWEGIADCVELRHRAHKPTLLALTKTNTLLRIDLETGLVLERVYLGPVNIKYKKIQWNNVEENFTLFSTLFPKQPVHFLRQAGMEVTDVRQLTVMSCQPLDFVCKMSITCQVFGKDTVDVTVFLNILVVMHASGHVRLYSLNEVLLQERTHKHRLYDQLDDGSNFGVYPSHLTINIKLTEAPPCLLEVRCRNRDVMLTMPPCHYLMWPFGNTQGYCCFSLSTGQMVENGCILGDTYTIEDRVSLHYDDSSRILHIKDSEVRVLKLIDNKQEEKKLVEDFSIKFSETPKVPETKVSKSGRIIKQRKKQDCGELQDQAVVSVHYSEDLDMMVVTSCTSEEQDGGCVTVGFYNNWTGQLMQSFKLGNSPQETMEQSVCYNLDTITHTYKKFSGQNQFEMHVYKLQALEERDEHLSNGPGFKGQQGRHPLR